MDLFLSFLTGGASGLLGTVLSGVMTFFQAKQRHQQAVEMRHMDLEEMRLETETAEKRAALELEARTAEADAKALAASYREAGSRWSKGLTLTPLQVWVMVFIDAIRGLMRPALTLFYLYGTYAIWSAVTPGAEDGLHAAHAMVYLSTTCTLWWFGSRHVERAMK